MEQPFLSVVVPAYNEARRLPRNLKKIIDFLRERSYTFEVIVVDDGSTDDTAQQAREVINGDPRARIIENPHYGKGFAVRSGMLAAVGEIVLFTDADLSVPIESIDDLLPWFEQGYDIVFGSREGGGSGQRVGEPFYRHLMGRIFNLLVQRLAIPGVQDTQCGFKAMRREVVREVFPQLLIHDGSKGPIDHPMVTAFDVELLFLARRAGYRLKEVPVTWYYGNESKVDAVADSWRNMKDVLTVRWNLLRGRYPSSHLARANGNAEDK
jgi:dolichyl-phosphate beta-glucosyltransferase